MHTSISTSVKDKGIQEVQISYASQTIAIIIIPMLNLFLKKKLIS